MIPALLLLSCRCAPAPTDATLQPEDIGHYAVMTGVVDAVKAGDLAAVKDLSRQLEGGADATDPALGEHTDRLHGAVGFAVAASDLEDAAYAVAVMGRACRDCHAAAGSPLMVSPPSKSAEGLAAHAAGAEAVWMGYIAADQGVYLAGLARFPRGLEGELGEAARALAERHAMTATTAPPTAAPEAGRPEDVAELLLTCAGCH